MLNLKVTSLKVNSCYLLLLFVAVFCPALACSDSRASVVVQLRNPDASSSPEISAELATTGSQRQLGLMYRKKMAEKHGMLFIFPAEKERSFWMKNTYLELDMIFLDRSLRVVSIIHRATPLTLTPRPSVLPASYVLEVGGGLAKKWGVVQGSTLDVQGTLPTPS